MNRYQKTARLVGALFLFSNVTFLLGAIFFVEPLLGASNYLALAATEKNVIMGGVLLEIVNGIAYVGIAALIYPIFKPRFESLALGYVAFRVVEFVMQILSDISPLALISLSEAFAAGGMTDDTTFNAAGILLLANRAWAFQMVSITFAVGALLFYTMAYRANLFPRFISIWGLVGAAIVLLNVLFDMFGISVPNLGVLMLANELFLGGWLLVKGFNQTAIESYLQPGGDQSSVLRRASPVLQK